MPRKKRTLSVCDAETDPFSLELAEADELPQPFLWGYYNGTDYHEFKETVDFVEFIGNQHDTCYAHNGGKFDFHYLLEYAEQQTVKIINGRIASFSIGDCRFMDSFILLPVALDRFQKTEIDYTKFHKSVRHRHMPEISGYLKSDCTNLYSFITQFAENYPLRQTLAGSALQVWRKQFHGLVDKTSKRFYDKFTPYYYGGRCEAFKKGVFKGDFKIYDIKSAYPRAMCDDHPAGEQYTISDELPNTEEKIQRCFISGTCYSEGALPVRSEKGDISFPIGKISFHCTGWEYLAGIQTGTMHDVKIESVLSFMFKVTYRPYIEEFYKRKLDAEQTKNKSGREFAKLFMNSLYGKMAANPEKYREYRLEEYGQEMNDEWNQDGIFGSKQLFSKPLGEEKHRYYNLATSASITGSVRAKVWRAICKTDKPYYCDTDSIMCEGDARLDMGKEVGQWDIEATADKVAIAGKKLYCCFMQEKAIKQANKGVRITGKEIEKVAKGEEVVYLSTIPTYSIHGKSGYTSRRINRT